MSFNPNLDFKDKLKRTPLHHACNASNLTAATMILQRCKELNYDEDTIK